MYTINVPFKDYKDRARQQSVTFNLDGREVFKMLPELKSVFDWIESNRDQEVRELTVDEVRSFYNDLEQIILEAWGEMSEDGQYFRKGGKFEFEESALFNACMILFVTKPQEAVKLLEGIMPTELFELVKNANPEQLEEAQNLKLTEQEAEIIRLKAQIAEGQTVTE